MSMSFFPSVASTGLASNLNSAQDAVKKLFGQLSSGTRLTDASVDPAALSQATMEAAQQRSYDQAQRNANDALSMTQVADGSLDSMGSALSQMRDQAVQASSTTDPNAQADLNAQFASLRSQVDSIAATSQYNGSGLLDGTLTNGVSVQVGPDAGQTVAVTVGQTDSTTIGNGGNSAQTLGAASLNTQGSAQAAIATIDQAMAQVSTARANLGSAMDHLASASMTDSTASVNIAQSLSRIADVDVASATAALAHQQILAQSGVAILVHANQASGMALNLIR